MLFGIKISLIKKADEEKIADQKSDEQNMFGKIVERGEKYCRSKNRRPKQKAIDVVDWQRREIGFFLCLRGTAQIFDIAI